MIRIKYKKYGGGLISEVMNIYGNNIGISICKSENNYEIRITLANPKIKHKLISTKSLQTAKRKVRKILKEEFEVNLGEEIRSKLCV